MRVFSLTRRAFALLLAVSIGLLGACESGPATTTSSPTATIDGVPPVAAAYICPMGCEGSASNQPGKCPACEMALERNPDYKAEAQ